MLDRISDALVRWRWWFAAATVLSMALAFITMQGITLDTTNEAFFEKDDEISVGNERFKSIFGNDDSAIILVAAKDGGTVFRTEILSHLDKLSDDLRLSVPWVRDVQWFGSAEFIGSTPDGLAVDRLNRHPWPQSAEALDRLRDKVMGRPEWRDLLISRDGKAAAIVVDFYPYPEGVNDPRKEIAPAIYAALDRFPSPGLDVRTAGGVILDYEFDRLAGEQAALTAVVAIVVMFVILSVFTGSVWGTLVSLLVVIVGMILTLGVAGLIGWPLTMLVVMLPTVLISVTIADSVHVLSAAESMRRDIPDRAAAMRKAIRHLLVPCAYTALTTVLGFLSTIGSGIPPMWQTGVIADVGVLLALAATFFLVPALWIWAGRWPSLFRRRVSPPVSRSTRLLDALFERLADFAVRRAWWIIACFLACAAVAASGWVKLRIETNAILSMDKGMPLRDAVEMIDATLGGSMSLELMVEGEERAILREDVLRYLARMEEGLSSDPRIWRQTSLLDIIRPMHAALRNLPHDSRAMPERSEEVREILFLYEVSGGGALSKYVNFNQSATRVTLRTRNLGLVEVKEVSQSLNRWLEANPPPDGIGIRMTGSLAVISALEEKVRNGQANSLLLAGVMITLCMVAMTRSLKSGLVSMIPNVTPVLGAIGILGHLDIPLSLSLVMFGAVSLGVIVDDTTHYFAAFHRHFQETGRYDLSARGALRFVGRPLCITTIVLCCGFLVSLISSFETTRVFGLLAAFTFAWGLLADLLVVPALFKALRLLGPEREEAGEAQASFHHEEAHAHD